MGSRKGIERDSRVSCLKARKARWKKAMQISDIEVKKLIRSKEDLVREINAIAEGIDDPTYEIDPTMVAELTQKVMQMPDREDRIAELRAEIEAGTYRPKAEQIVEAMIRRTIADRVR
jgi:anti-sigma28 factor (negative regulator of flagellin synthesis)